jgi:type II secretory pathway pseudopilin PulG
MTMTCTNQRGSALLTSVIVILVMTVIGIGVVRFASREVAGAQAGAREQALVACADAARQLLLSQFHALGVSPVQVAALNVPLDGPAATAHTYALGGHLGTMNVSVDQVSYLPENAMGPSDAIPDLTNQTAIGGQGGRPMKLVVHCQDGGDGSATSGRQLEVEFGVRFGL